MAAPVRPLNKEGRGGIGNGTGFGGKILYACASVCIKERFCLYYVALRAEARQSDLVFTGKIGANCGSPVVHSVAFSPDGKTLASESFDGIVKLWVGDAR